MTVAASRDTLIAVRKELVDAAAEDAVNELTSHREPPKVIFVASGKTPGLYLPESNVVEIRESGFLDDPGIGDDAIRATVAHEHGHWADRHLDARHWNKRLCMVSAGVVASPLVVIMCSAKIVGWGLPVVLSAFCGFLLTGMVYVLVAALWCQWPSEYEADQVAVRLVGRPAVIAMLEQSAHQYWPSLTHPSRRSRIRRLGG